MLLNISNSINARSQQTLAGNRTEVAESDKGSNRPTEQFLQYGLDRFPEGTTLEDARDKFRSSSVASAKKSLAGAAVATGLATAAVATATGGAVALPVVLGVAAAGGVAFGVKKGLDALTDRKLYRNLNSRPDVEPEKVEEQSPVKSAFVRIGKSVSEGAFLGFGAALAVAGATALSPALGIVATAGMIVAGAVQGVVSYGKVAERKMGGKLMGNMLAAVMGGGVTALCIGLGPVGEPIGHALKGLGMGAFFGLLAAPGKS